MEGIVEMIARKVNMQVCKKCPVVLGDQLFREFLRYCRGRDTIGSVDVIQGRYFCGDIEVVQ